MKPGWLIVSFLIATWVVPLVFAARYSVSRPEWLRKGRNQVVLVVAWMLVVVYGLRFLLGMWP